MRLCAGADSYKFFSDTKSFAPNWFNEVTLRSAELWRENEPAVYVSRISPTPLLMIVADHDVLALTDLGLAAYESALQPKRLLLIKGRHFAPYAERFAESSRAAMEWFSQHLKPNPLRD